MIRSPAELRQADHDEQARLYAEFLAKGGRPTILKAGEIAASGTALLPHSSPDQRRGTRALTVVAGARRKTDDLLLAMTIGQKYTASEVVALTGQQKTCVYTRLGQLRNRGELRSHGVKPHMTWERVP